MGDISKWMGWKTLAIGLTAAGLLSGCSRGGVQDAAGQPVPDVYKAFSTGEVRLRCNISCSGRWGMERQKWTALYQNQLWQDLALSVADVNFQGDVQYFYLGRAAEGLGFYQAADTYYRLSRTVTFRCGGSSECGNVNVPVAVSEGLVRVAPAVQASAPKPLASPVPATLVPLAPIPIPIPIASRAPASPSVIQATSEKVSVNYDEFTKNTTYSSDPLRKLSSENGLINEVVSALAATAKPSGTVYVLVVNHSHESIDANRYNTVLDASGEALQYTKVKTDVSSCHRSMCLYSEMGAIKVTRAYLEARASSGMRIRLQSTLASQIVEIPGTYISTFLESVPK
ncbi:hypothetical protein D3C85_969990 [compost metagenome]